MSGVDFYEFLRKHYNRNGQTCGNFSFCDWLYKPKNGTYSFRFNIPGNKPKKPAFGTAKSSANNKIKNISLFN